MIRKLILIRKLIFMAALFAPVVAYGQTNGGGATFPIQQIGSDPIACAIGPNTTSGPTGVAATDTQTAGFTTCALNSDFGTPFFANFNNWLGGGNSCGRPAAPIWYNTSSVATTAPCSDYTIITDPTYGGQVLDIRFTNADASAGRPSTQLISVSGGYGSAGHAFPTGIYVEQRFRLTPNTTTAYNGTGQQTLVFQPFRYPAVGYTGPFVEWDWDEFYFNPIGIAGNQGCARGCSGVFGQGNPPWSYCNNNCTDFDPTVYHTYGSLVTTNGNDQMSVCFYLDGVTINGGHCVNYTGITDGPATWQALEQLIIELGPNNVITTGFSGPLDVYYQYMRVFSCAGWNTGNSSNPASGNPTCAGTMVNY